MLKIVSLKVKDKIKIKIIYKQLKYYKICCSIYRFINLNFLFYFIYLLREAYYIIFNGTTFIILLCISKNNMIEKYK